MARKSSKAKEPLNVRTDPRRHTPVFRGSFAHLAKPNRIDEDSDPRYSILVVLDPEDDEQADYIEAIEDWVEELALDKWGEVPRRLKSPIKEGEELGEEFEGMVCFQAHSDRKPGIVDAELEPIDEMDQDEELYSGAWYRISIRPYAWEHKTGGKGVSFGLDNVMKVEDDEPLGGGKPKAEDDFADAKSAGRSKARARGRRR